MKMVKELFKEGNEVAKGFAEAKIIWPLISVLGMIFYPVALVVTGTAVTIFSRKISNLICDNFEKEGKINLSSYLYHFAFGLNEGIEGVRKISEEFENLYKNK